MELNDLRIFVATVDAGSFTAAADQLMLSSSSSAGARWRWRRRSACGCCTEHAISR